MRCIIHVYTPEQLDAIEEACDMPEFRDRRLQVNEGFYIYDPALYTIFTHRGDGDDWMYPIVGGLHFVSRPAFTRARNRQGEFRVPTVLYDLRLHREYRTYIAS